MSSISSTYTTNKIQTLITDYYINKQTNKQNDKKESCYCIECGVDMGPQNPRQLCGKTYCMFLID
jgi:hypothetical protein